MRIRSIAVLMILTAAVATGIDAKNRNNTIIAKAGSSITFTVDADLPVPASHMRAVDASGVCRRLFYDYEVPEEAMEVITTSFSGDSLCVLGKDVLFQTIVRAYAEHRPLVLSPDMIWMAISQGFGQHVNRNAEKLRPMLVNHEGKADLVITDTVSPLSAGYDWNKAISGFAGQVEKYTKDGVAKTLVADFSTTGDVERIASRMVLMDNFKPYFDYVSFNISCGIPSVTIEGTPDDWRSVIGRTKKLAEYDLGWWTKDLLPILDQFLKASRGKPDTGFWQDIVSTRKMDSLRGGGCSPDKPSKIDGWFLRLFPYDEEGLTPQTISWSKSMPGEQTRTNMICREVSPDGEILSETDLELMAGFVGVKEDPETFALRPQIGWIVHRSVTEEVAFADLQRQNKHGCIVLRVIEVPEMLKKLDRIRSLSLTFAGEVVLPEWMDDMTIGYLTIEGSVTGAQKQAIIRRFPKTKITFRQVPRD